MCLILFYNPNMTYSTHNTRNIYPLISHTGEKLLI